jgi:hypothetical protein
MVIAGIVLEREQHEVMPTGYWVDVTSRTTGTKDWMSWMPMAGAWRQLTEEASNVLTEVAACLGVATNTSAAVRRGSSGAVTPRTSASWSSRAAAATHPTMPWPRQ